MATTTKNPPNKPRLHKIGEVESTGAAVLAPLPATKRTRSRKRSHRVALIDLDVASKIEMTQMEWAVLLTIARYIPSLGGCEARVSLAEVADIVGMRRPNVSRIVASLTDRLILFRGERQGVWYVNPHILYSGDFAQWNASLDDYTVPMIRRQGRTS